MGSGVGAGAGIMNASGGGKRRNESNQPGKRKRIRKSLSQAERRQSSKLAKQTSHTVEAVEGNNQSDIEPLNYVSDDNKASGRVPTDAPLMTGKEEDQNSVQIDENASKSTENEGQTTEKKGGIASTNDNLQTASAGRGNTESVSKRRPPCNLNVIVLLEGANLETVKVPGRAAGLALLNSEDHAHILKKTKREANDARPDILHQCLLTLLDSPLNKAGKLKVYVRSAKNALIEVHPNTRIPRTVRRFYGLMVELLQRHKVRGTTGSSPLLKLIRNPVTSHLPINTRKIVCTYNCENIVDIRDHAARMAELVSGSKISRAVNSEELHAETEEQNDSEPLTVLYVVGAIAHGKITEDWAEESICISEYPLSAATVCSRITYAYECLLDIL